MDCKCCVTQAVSQLGRYKTAANDIYAMVSGKPPLTGLQKAEARKLFKALKESLRMEYCYLGRVSVSRYISTWAETAYKAAITEAYLSLTVRSNSIPNQQWADCLIDCMFYVDYWLSHFKR